MTKDEFDVRIVERATCLGICLVLFLLDLPFPFCTRREKVSADSRERERGCGLLPTRLRLSYDDATTPPGGEGRRISPTFSASWPSGCSCPSRPHSASRRPPPPQRRCPMAPRLPEPFRRHLRSCSAKGPLPEAGGAAETRSNARLHARTAMRDLLTVRLRRLCRRKTGSAFVSPVNRCGQEPVHGSPTTRPGCERVRQGRRCCS
jgi:hypothetical protein